MKKLIINELECKNKKTKEAVSLILEHGSLLIMKDTTQTK